MTASFVDSHCHIPIICAGAEDLTPADVVARAEEAGVDHMLCVGVDLPSFPEVAQVAGRFENVYGSVGVHPNTPGGIDGDAEVTVEDLATRSAGTRIVAVGETGLDFYRDDVPIALQYERFRTHIRAAREVGKPLIIHSRDAGHDLIDVLAKEGAADVGGVMHCFVDSWEVAERAIELGFLISFSGIVTFRNAREVQETAAQVPLEHMLVETDSPWLAPVPFRGKSNEPAYVRHVAECIAELKDLSLDEVAETTTRNFFRLFAAATPCVGGAV